jgi:hypothetical protein
MIVALFANGLDVLGAVAVATAFGVGVLVLLRRRGSAEGVSGGDRDGFAELVALCYGERDLAERLVAAQAARAPVSSPRQHVWAAIDRLRADRRR